jgi:hypothetical protein
MGASQNCVPEPFLAGIDITNTFTSPIEFRVTLRIPVPIFFRKIALSISNIASVKHMLCDEKMHVSYRTAIKL